MNEPGIGLIDLDSLGMFPNPMAIHALPVPTAVQPAGQMPRKKKRPPKPVVTTYCWLDGKEVTSSQQFYFVKSQMLALAFRYLAVLSPRAVDGVDREDIVVCHTCYKATFVNLKDALQLIDRLVLSVPTLTPGTAVRGSGGKSIRKQVVAVAKSVVATPVDTLLPTLVLPAFLKPGGWSMLHVHTGSGVFLDSSTNISGKCTIIQCDALTGTIVVNDCVQHRHVVKQSRPCSRQQSKPPQTAAQAARISLP